MSPSNERFRATDYLAPKHWPTWLGIGLLYLSSRLPYAFIVRLGTALGWLSFYLMPQRRRITRTNLRKVFPDIDEDERQRLLRRCFYSASIALFETAWAWWASDKKIKPLYRIEGLEHLKAAQKKGKGVILLGAHWTTIEMSGRLMAYHADNIHTTYKPAHNDLFEALMTHNRTRMNKGIVASNDMRAILKLLKDQQILWYAPDQDFGREKSVFAPFMGVQTATLTMTARLARVSGAAVVPLYSERLPGQQGYRLRLGRMLENFPSGNEVRDATTINRLIEAQLKLTPSQYLWGHRRFKTRPEGELPFYPLRPPTKLKLYRLLLASLALPLVLHTAYLAFKFRDKAYLYERLGRFGRSATIARGGIWVHTASVGEVNAVLPLIKALQAQYAELPICLTTTTPTGGQAARARLPDGVRLYYLPLDWHGAVQRFLDHTRPLVSLIMETELWPNLHEAAFNQGVPIIIINGRLTEKTLQAPRWLYYLYHRMMVHAQAVIARSTEDRQRFARLGVREDRLFQIDNIKFAPGEAHATPAAIDLQRPYVLAASTREKEEVEIIHAWQQLPQPRPLLVIAPRHPKRLAEILADLDAFGLNIAIRSRQQPVTETTDLYLADTLGELAAFMAGATLVFMGGSLVDKGGHNILEPARLGKAIIVGPYMDNFREETQLLLQSQGLLQVANRDALAAQLQTLLQQPERARQLGDHARAAIDDRAGVIEAYLQCLQQLYPFTQQIPTAAENVHQLETLIS
ncbi:MAG: LpxL/LpxP family Kdo(2)-lipid IV(A) lauroyl/palmitoleoyl acyltransferase [Gammaproteobacteria bacterium]